MWGSGTPRREFLHVDDLAEATVFCMEHYDDAGHINVGVGQDISIKELAILVSEIVGYSGDVVFDDTKPDGQYRKDVDSSKLISVIKSLN